MAIWESLLVGELSDEKTLGRRLADARRQAGLTQEELCQQTGLSYSTLAKIERGAIKSPSVFTVAAIAKATGASIEQLLGIKSVGSSKQVSKTGIKFVYFDLNGVLVRFFYRAFTQIAHDAKTSAETVETLFWRHNDAVCRGKKSTEAFNKLLGNELGLKSFDWSKYYLKAIEPMPKIKELVQWAAQNYDVGILTNSMNGVVKPLIAKGVIPPVDYKAIIDSSEVGVIKPESKIYEIAQKAAGVKPQEILLIDDGRTNLVAADKLGWRVQWFDDYQPDEGIRRAKESLAF